jgi:hypothetical protein
MNNIRNYTGSKPGLGCVYTAIEVRRLLGNAVMCNGVSRDNKLGAAVNNCIENSVEIPANPRQKYLR